MINFFKFYSVPENLSEYKNRLKIPKIIWNEFYPEKPWELIRLAKILRKNQTYKRALEFLLIQMQNNLYYEIIVDDYRNIITTVKYGHKQYFRPIF